MNTQYKNNLTAVMQASKKYTDDKIEQALELLEDYDLSSDTISQTSASATAPSDVRTASLIQVGGNSVKYAPSTASDDTVSKIKSIPLSTFTLGVDYVGGYTEPSENKAVFNDVAETTTNGITYKVENGVITFISGTAGSGGISITFDLINTLPSGSYYYKNFGTGTRNIGIRLSDNTTVWGANSGASYNISTNIVRMYFYFSEGDSVSNEVYKPMLASGSTAPTAWKEGFTGLRSAKTSEIKVSGNLMNVSIESGIFGSSGEKANNTRRIRTADKISLSAGTYTISFTGVNSIAVYIYDTNDVLKNTPSWQDTNEFTFTVDYDFKVNFAWRKTTDDVLTPSDMTSCLLNKGSVVILDITKQIPSEIYNNEYYGLGLSSSLYNSLNLISKKLNKKLKSKDLSTLTWVWHSNSNKFYSASLVDEIKTTTIPLSDKYTCSLSSSSDDNSLELSSNGYLWVKTDGTSATTPSGTLVYELTTYEDIDMSTYLDDSFKTFTTNDQYTDIEMVNQYNYDMPNKISYFGTIKETLVEDITITNVGEQPQTIDLLDSDVSDGWSASASIFNYRDIRERKRHKVVARIDLGTLDWGIVSANKFSPSGALPNAKAGGLCLTAKYNYVSSVGTVTTTDKTITIVTADWGNIRPYLHDNDYNDATALKTALSGVYLYYELATEVIEDLDIPYDLHYLPLTSGGTAVFNNDNNQQCHNTIRYSIMEAKE